MKMFKHIALGLSVMLAATACDSNDPAEFSDGDAFVAFDKADVSVAEKGDGTYISITLASVSGKSAKVRVNIAKDESNTAVEGKDFKIDGSNELSFDAEHRTASIKVLPVPDGIFTGDRSVKLTLEPIGDIKVGFERNCVVRFVDAEHPLQFILHEYKGKAQSVFGDTYEWKIALTKDDKDVSKVYISNLVEGLPEKVYGVVNEEMTEIAIPAHQFIKDYDATNAITLEGFTTPDPNDPNASQLQDGENIIMTISEDGHKLVMANAYGALVGSLGWWDVFLGGVEFTY